MAKKQFFLVVDTETTIKNNVADFGAAVFDRQGNIFESCAVLVKDFRNEQLFHNRQEDGTIWGLEGLKKRTENYEKMLDEGTRQLASVAAINRFMGKVRDKYPEISLTAYNVAFDLNKMDNSGIHHASFTNRFCLWHLAVGHFADTRKYKQFALDNHYFGAPTEKTRACTILTNAEVMSEYLTGIKAKEPHTAFEDITGHEAHILHAVVNRKDWRKKEKPYSYRDFQVNAHFMVE